MTEFKKGDIITYKHDVGALVFAIMDDQISTLQDSDKEWHDLMAYYNPYYEENEEVKSVFTITLNSADPNKRQDCGYVFDDETLQEWRLCTEEECMEVLEMLAKVKHVALDPITKELRELKSNETLHFGTPHAAAHTRTPARREQQSLVKSTFVISDNDKAVAVMGIEMRETIMEACKEASKHTYDYPTQGGRKFFWTMADDEDDEYSCFYPRTPHGVNHYDDMPYDDYGFGGQFGNWY